MKTFTVSINAIAILLITLISASVFAQIHPVQSTPQLVPPYSVYLSDYATPGSEKLRVILIQRDLTQPSYDLRLVMSVELNGKIIMRTSHAFRPSPISLSPGVPTIISGAELAPYLDSRNIDFIGYSREQYEKTKALPEGSYQLIFTAYDYRRQDVQVSNAGGSFYYLMKNEPPLINFPACGSKIPMRTPQQIIFSWLPRNTASPNSAAETQYELSLYEIRPAGRNPNDIVQTLPPVFTTITDVTQYIYGPGDPMLLDNITYAWRVRAIDKSGRDAFRNNGYSEVCTFTSGVPEGVVIGNVKDFHAEAETAIRGRAWWAAGDFDAYRVNYRKVGEGYEWFTVQVTAADLAKANKSEPEAKLFDLEADTEYEARVQGKKKEYYGGYSDIEKFKTPPPGKADCGVDEAPPFGDMSKPIALLLPGFIIQIDDMYTVLKTVMPLGGGYFKGSGFMIVDFLGKAPFSIKFDSLFVDEDRLAGDGRVDYITRGVAQLIEQQAVNAAKNEKERTQQENRDRWADTDFYDKIFLYDIIIDTVTVTGIGYINVTDSEGNTTVNAEIAQVLLAYPTKAIIIQDVTGDQYVVQKDAAANVMVTKVGAGGLLSGNSVAVTQAEIDLLKKVLKQLRDDYSEAKINAARSDYTQRKKTLNDYQADARREFLSGNSSAAPVNGSGGSPLLLSAEVIQKGNDDFSSISADYKHAETIYNIAKVIHLLSRDTNTDEERTIIVQNLNVKGVAFGAYVDKRKKEGGSESQLIAEIKEAIVSIVTSVLKNKY